MTHRFNVGDRVRYIGDNRYRTPGSLGVVTSKLRITTVYPLPRYVVSWDDGKPEATIEVRETSLELETPVTYKLDTTKPLEVIFPSGNSGGLAPFITLTSEGHILTGKCQHPDACADWIIWTAEGKFVRSSKELCPGSGALSLRNKVERKCEYMVIRPDRTSRSGYFDRALAWDRNPTAQHMVQIDTEDGVVTGVGVLKRPKP